MILARDLMSTDVVTTDPGLRIAGRASAPALRSESGTVALVLRDPA
jgi:hypothetical protein